jgi:hypothetical protein
MALQQHTVHEILFVTSITTNTVMMQKCFTLNYDSSKQVDRIRTTCNSSRIQCVPPNMEPPRQQAAAAANELPGN